MPVSIVMTTPFESLGTLFRSNAGHIFAQDGVVGIFILQSCKSDWRMFWTRVRFRGCEGRPTHQGSAVLTTGDLQRFLSSAVTTQKS